MTLPYMMGVRRCAHGSGIKGSIRAFSTLFLAMPASLLVLGSTKRQLQPSLKTVSGLQLDNWGEYVMKTVA
jgi:hypothetical protein